MGELTGEFTLKFQIKNVSDLKSHIAELIVVN